MSDRASRYFPKTLSIALPLMLLVGSNVAAQEPSETAKRQSLAQRISALSTTMKQKLGDTFGRSESDDQENHQANCKCCQTPAGSAQIDSQMNESRSVPRQINDNQHEIVERRLVHQSEQPFHQIADLRSMNQNVADQHHDSQTLVPREPPSFSSASRFTAPADTRVETPVGVSENYASHSPIHISKHHPTETAEFREILNGGAETEKAAFYEGEFVGDSAPPSEADYNAGQNHNAVQHDRYYHALPTDVGTSGASGASPALPNPVLAQQNAGVSGYPAPSMPGGQIPPYAGYHLGNRQITATEHALFLKSENETLKASQRALLAEKERLRETIRLNQEMLAKSEQAMIRATEQLKAADRKNLEWEQKYAALEKEHKRFVRDTDRTLDSIRNDLDEVLVSEINATR